MKCFSYSIAALIAVSSYSSAVTFYRYAPSGTDSSTQSKHQNIAPNNTQKALFPGLSDDEVWISFFQSDYIIGKSSADYVRAWDLSEDWQFNFITPDNDGRNYYRDFWANNDSSIGTSATSYPREMRDGIHAGQSIIGSSQLIAAGDNRFLFYDMESGTLSAYNYTNGLQVASEGGWTYFGDSGPWAGERLADKMQYFIGYEEGNIYFLDGDNTIIQYDLQKNSGDSSKSRDGKSFEYNLTGDLAEYNLRQIIDGEVAGYTYIGWDIGAVIIALDLGNYGPRSIAPIPEPASASLTLLALGSMVIRRRQS